ncbi:hypothetical protein ACPRNU_21980 [Chromobacterium vaccinii]|uniref:hypothetical protein n=1 Tax=Chromobacterium TaxID=535 RepID=UPI00130519DB|nr:hypothetical protein [Chromobacterium sp. ATCC 53434]
MALGIEPLARYIDHNRKTFNRRHRGGKPGGDGAILFIGTKTDCKLFAEIIEEALHHHHQPMRRSRTLASWPMIRPIADSASPWRARSGDASGRFASGLKPAPLLLASGRDAIDCSLGPLIRGRPSLRGAGWEMRTVVAECDTAQNAAVRLVREN